ncbi:MAG: hypothetical protein US54_C0061G0001 [Candidatus Roizmanbacteria bacterium GW2011_GWA2_37_7]|uniref:Uncharacterized protein n=1 Tax=Candidatus Roizmanbacteria bacterium GW2011_GWA2_37_7 TaxID=1618481 RepID=A0A0G0H3B7_9BACT|nr:MAG: hypothetical protein US54_C0061G0001 [Candidatus Roizmanbacteria bacterium GW2011_GWA2_37_7]
MLNYLFTKTPLLFFVQNLWRDEAFTYLMSQQSIGDILRTTAADFNPPLYYLFMHAWMLMFGSSEIAMRTVSLLFYVLTIYIMFEIMAVVFQISFKRALIYFLLIILNPMLLTFAFEARMYMMAAFFVTLSYFALLTKRKKLYIAAMTLALYTHYFTVLILAAQIISSIVDSVCRTRGLAHVTSTWKDKAVFLIPLILFIPWLLFLISYHDLSIAEFWIATPKAQDIMYLPFVLFTGYQRVFGESQPSKKLRTTNYVVSSSSCFFIYHFSFCNTRVSSAIFYVLCCWTTFVYDFRTGQYSSGAKSSAYTNRCSFCKYFSTK